MKITYFFLTIYFFAFWLLLNDGNVFSLVVGVFFIVLAVAGSYRLNTDTKVQKNAPKIQLERLPKFLVFFFYNSLKGGLGTAKLAFSPTLSLTPDFVHYPIKRLQTGASTQLFMNLVSLLPGSVSVIREPTGILVHVLNSGTNTTQELQQCELAVSHLFGINAPNK
tara:strand:+ start:2280 stop:2777 length:498 start_codon:yes stop_codon:yes gene_type:complete